MTRLENVARLEEFLRENPDAIILKHSSACPISAAAYREFGALEREGGVALGIVFVLDNRSLSEYLAELSGIEHQSPQALFFRRGKCVDSLSHYAITVERMRKVAAAHGI